MTMILVDSASIVQSLSLHPELSYHSSSDHSIESIESTVVVVVVVAVGDRTTWMMMVAMTQSEIDSVRYQDASTLS